MIDVAQTLLTLGCLFLVGLVTDLIGRRTPLPRVSLLLVFGFAVGPSALDLLPDLGRQWFPLVSHMALVMVGFLLGGSLTLPALREHGRVVLWVSVAEVFVTGLLVTVGLILLGVPLEISVLLGGIATATAPAATVDVVHEARAEGRFTRRLLGIVAVDDAWGLVAFSLAFAIAASLTGDGGTGPVLAGAARDLGGAALVGVGVGVPMALLTGRIETGEPTQAEALGGVFLCGGIALWLDVSFLLASMIQGIVVANLARHHNRPFHAIEGIEWPFMILFFVLAGAALRVDALAQVGVALVGFVVLRIAGRVVGAYVGGRLAGADRDVSRWMGIALMPQAGVALGMALIASQRFPETGQGVLSVTIGAVVFFEAVGPICTRLALVRTGEAHLGPRPER